MKDGEQSQKGDGVGTDGKEETYVDQVRRTVRGEQHCVISLFPVLNRSIKFSKSARAISRNAIVT